MEKKERIIRASLIVGGKGQKKKPHFVSWKAQGKRDEKIWSLRETDILIEI